MSIRLNNTTRDYEKDWEEHWKEICSNPDGSLNLDQIKRELSDFIMVAWEATGVVSHVTGGILSYPHYPAQTVNYMADQHYSDMWNEIFKDDISDILNDANMNEQEKLDEIKKYINS